MKPELFSLLYRRSFLAFFLTQFLGAFNDNVFKTALSLLIAFNAVSQAETESSVLVNLAAICFILPFFLFSPTAGSLADYHHKVRLIRLVKLTEIFIMLLAIVGFYLNSPLFLIGVLFLMGAQSTLFGPLKYSYLPTVLEREQLVGANAWIQASTFVGIIAGMMLAGLLFSWDGEAHAPVMVAVLLIAVLGWISSLFIPLGNKISSTQGREKGSIISLLRLARGQRHVWPAILGISWFWMVGATYITQLPNYVRFYVQADEQVFLLCLGLFAIGIGSGSLLCAWLRRFDSGRFSVLIGLIGLFLAGVLVALYPKGSLEVLRGWSEFVGNPVDQGLMVGLFMLGVSGGLYIVPLYTVLQTCSDERSRSRMVALNNVLNAAYMVVSAAIVLGLLAAGLSISELFLLLALANVVMLLYYVRGEARFLTKINAIYH